MKSFKASGGLVAFVDFASINIPTSNRAGVWEKYSTPWRMADRKEGS